jgi:cytochrome P450
MRLLHLMRMRCCMIVCSEWNLVMVKETIAAGHEIVCWSCFGAVAFFQVCSPRMLEYMLGSGAENNWINFEKGAEVTDPLREALGHGIFTVNDAEWRRQRKVASHLFSQRRLVDHMMNVFHSHAKLVVARLEEVQHGGVIDMQDLFQRYTLDSIGAIAFGVEIGSLTAGAQPPFAKAFDLVQCISSFRNMTPPIVWKTKRMLGIGDEGQLAKGVVTINEYVYAVVRARRQNIEHFDHSQSTLDMALQLIAQCVV